jgi:D-glycero-D-manno-heptose 1,7-bisphosphate phosphatase
MYAGIDARLAQLQRAGFKLVVITNQSGIARGYFTEDDFAAMTAHLRNELAQSGVALDGVYHCPHHPDGVIPALAIRCGCRKPQPGMLLRAASELGIDLAASWMIGDILDDVEAGWRAGAQTVLVDLETERPSLAPYRQPTYIARKTCHALDIIQAVEGLHPAPELVGLNYWPSAWSRQARGRSRGAMRLPIPPLGGFVGALDDDGVDDQVVM